MDSIYPVGIKNQVLLRIEGISLTFRRHETWSFFVQVKAVAGITPGFTRFGLFF
jgi:hypothetical protein